MNQDEKFGANTLDKYLNIIHAVFKLNRREFLDIQLGDDFYPKLLCILEHIISDLRQLVRSSDEEYKGLKAVQNLLSRQKSRSEEIASIIQSENLPQFKKESFLEPPKINSHPSAH
eukprot:Sdes_comp18619_c0_seq1m8798